MNRELQNQILTLAAEAYPESIYPGYDNTLNQHEERKLGAALKYLEQNYLIEKNSFNLSIDNFYSFGGITITNRGLDFLSDDGGLSAILNVVTVKFETNTLKAILERKINQSALPVEDKKSMIESLQELPAESIKHLTMKLLDEGLDNLPSAILLIGTYLGIS